MNRLAHDLTTLPYAQGSRPDDETPDDDDRASNLPTLASTDRIYREKTAST